MGHRKSINVGTKSHGTLPIPQASMKNGFLASGAIYGLGHGQTEPSSVDGQCEALFANMEAILQSAGGTFDDVIKVTVKLSDPASRDDLNRHWIAAFPDAASRPARHVDEAPLNRGNQLVAAEFLAIIEGQD